ncbi:MAG TPA: hypothetical protein VK470_05880 [Bacteroidota bacterium]|nr:hypothetical protein [Bacteroidota bacterium]
MKTPRILQMIVVIAACIAAYPASGQRKLMPTVPIEKRGNKDYERTGTHDANNIRTLFKNYGMVGSYPDAEGYKDVTKVDLSVFHSVEVPKGSGMNYSDGITPFVLARVKQTGGDDAYIMETGFRERQQLSPTKNRVMRFEPRPGYMQENTAINIDRSPAMSHLERTWPDVWPDKLDDADDPGWKGAWNGYFGKKPNASQESFFVMDDDYYDAWRDFVPDTRDLTRRGLGLRVEVRGFQWQNPQAGNVIFWHYDIANEGTNDFNENIVFGLYMDSGVGGSGLGCDPLPESDDDNAFYDKSLGQNLVYTWDTYGHGVNLSSSCGPTGYLGYAYLETPGKDYDHIDNDEDGMTDESRVSGPGTKIVGQQAIRAYVTANYNLQRFEQTYGPLENRPAFKAGVWFTGDEDLDWTAEFNDLGADGIAGTKDSGEGDGIPTEGEENFDKTDLHESDQIGLTGFKMNRIKAGSTHPSDPVDGITFYNDGTKNWPYLLYSQFTDPSFAKHFDAPLTQDYNIAFLFASGPFNLKAGSQERFSLALSYGPTLQDLKRTVKIVQQIYNANYRFAEPPPTPTLKAEAGDHYVRLSWDDVAERGIDPVTFQNDFEGYRLYRATDPEFRDAHTITNGQGTGPMVFGRPLVAFDLVDGKTGYSNQVVDGVAYYLGDDTGIRHEFKDTTAINGQTYYYALVSYDYGSDSLGFYPSENAVSVSRTPRGGVVLPKNVVEVRPEPKAAGYVPAAATSLIHRTGTGTGSVAVEIVNSAQVPDNRTLELKFKTNLPQTIHADYYTLSDSATGAVYIDRGTDFSGTGVGEVGSGVKPVVATQALPTFNNDPAVSRFVQKTSATNVRFKAAFNSGLSMNVRHFGYPNNLIVRFSSAVIDTSIDYDFSHPALMSKMKVSAIREDGSEMQLKYVLSDENRDGLISSVNDYLDIVDTTMNAFGLNNITWRIQLDTVGQSQRGPIVPPSTGDAYLLSIVTPFMAGDVYSFRTQAQKIDPSKAKTDFTEAPYVVPNPYVGAASFEPERFAISGRGERRIEFRSLPARCVIRIYTVTGDLVQTLYHDGSTTGAEAWNLRSKDNLDVAPGLYLFHVDGYEAGSHTGKFAIIK